MRTKGVPGHGVRVPQEVSQRNREENLFERSWKIANSWKKTTRQPPGVLSEYVGPNSSLPESPIDGRTTFAPSSVGRDSLSEKKKKGFADCWKRLRRNILRLE